MRERIMLSTAYLHGVLLLLSLLTVPAFAVSFFTGSAADHYVRLLTVLMPYIAASASARYSRSIFPFLLISLLSIAAELLVPMLLALRIISLALSLIIVIIKLVGRVRETNDILMSPHAAFLAVFAGLCLIGISQDIVLMKTVNYWVAFAYVIILMIFLNSGRMEEYLTVNEGVANIPFRQIRRTNYGMLGLYLVLVSAAMLLLPISGLDKLLNKFVDAVKALIRLIISSIRSDETITLPEIQEETTIPPTEEIGDLIIPEREAPPWVKDMLDTIFYVILAVIAIGILISIGKGLVRVVKKFYRPYRENNDEQEFISPVDQNESLLSRILPKRPLFLDRSPNAVVRRAYRKAVEKKAARQKDPGALMVRTPEEIEDYIKLDAAEDREKLHTLYEKARYSKEGVSKE